MKFKNWVPSHFPRPSFQEEISLHNQKKKTTQNPQAI